MEAVTLARLQFAVTIGFHILWPTFTIGLAAYCSFLSVLCWRTGKQVYRDLLRFWTKIFGLAFGMGVISGVVISYEIGANWAGFSRSVSNVLGPLFMYEVLTAFFLEAGFIGIMLFGERRVGPALYSVSCTMVALGSLVSATWIIAANSWMQTPQGADQDVNGIFHAVDWWAVVFTPSFPYRLSHMVCASFVTTSFVVAGISAVHLLRGRHLDSARVAFSMAMWAAIAFVPLQIALGDAHGRNTLAYQPTKLAAMEGLWETGSGVAMTVFAWPDMAGERNLWAIEVPKLASLYLTHSLDGTVQGLKAVPANERPNVPIVFFAFRIMVGIGLVLLATAICGAFLRWTGGLYDRRWFQIVAVAVSPLGFLAVLAGWVTTEAGRQPYVVYGYLRTADAASPVAAGAVASTLLAFGLVYNLLLATFLWFLVRIIWRGPDGVPGTPPLREGLDKSVVHASAAAGHAPGSAVLVAGE